MTLILCLELDIAIFMKIPVFISPLPRLLTPGNSIQYIMLSGAMGIPTHFSDLFLNKSGPRSPAGPQLGVVSCLRERERCNSLKSLNFSLILSLSHFSRFPHAVSECLLASVGRLAHPIIGCQPVTGGRDCPCTAQT